MQWSIRNKLILGGSAMMSLFAIAAFVAYLQARLVGNNLTQVTTVAVPLKASALEMQLSLVDAGFSVMSYLHNREPLHVAEISVALDKFTSYHGQYETLAQTPQLRAQGVKANTAFARYRDLANQLIRNSDAQARRALDLRASFNELAELHDTSILPAITAVTPQAIEKRDAARQMKMSLNDLQANYMDFASSFDSASEMRVRKALLTIASHHQRYLRTPLSPQEQEWMNQFERHLTTAKATIDEALVLFAMNRQVIGDFVRARREMDDLLEYEIQTIVRSEMTVAENRLVAVAKWMNVALIALLLGGAALGAGVGVAVYRGVTVPVNRLREVTQAMAHGEFVGADEVVSQGEFSALSQSFREMVLARRHAEEAIRGMNAGLEKRNLEAAQITKMSNLLQTASDMREAGEILALLAQQVLAPHSGIIYLTAASLNRLHGLAHWGGTPYPEVMDPDECWGMRRGAVYAATHPQQDIYCAHVHADASHLKYLCVPMMAHGVSLGLLHVTFAPDEGSTLPEAELQRVQRLADQIALALANLKLRTSLREQSIRDALTGLHNRRYLEESLECEVARALRNKKPLAVLMVDVDHFKRFNDQFGHEGGDAVLQALGRVLRKTARQSDLVARYGGEEFTVLLHDTPATGAIEWGERLREAVRNMEVKFAGQTLPPITISLGLAIYPENGVSGEALIHTADAALYGAKHGGRDRLVVATPLAAISDSAWSGVVVPLHKEEVAERAHATM
ncbi:MAG: diguanylate cyclase [Burkholderiales bacterium]